MTAKEFDFLSSVGGGSKKSSTPSYIGFGEVGGKARSLIDAGKDTGRIEFFGKISGFRDRHSRILQCSERVFSMNLCR
jgi:hypothetical protein